MQSSRHVNDLRELKVKLSANKRTMACIVMIMMVILNMTIGNDTIGDVSSDDDYDYDDDYDDGDGKMNARTSIMPLRSCFV